MQARFVRSLRMPSAHSQGKLAQILKDRQVDGRLIGGLVLVELLQPGGGKSFACGLAHHAGRGGRNPMIAAALYPANAEGEVTSKLPIVDAATHAMLLPTRGQDAESFGRRVIARLAKDLG